jgi:tetratricopeptide (TPR) repeat protein
LLGRRVGAAQAGGHVAVAAAMAERIGGDLDVSLERLEDATQRFAALDDTYGLAYAINQRGHTLRWGGDLKAAVACFDEAEALRRWLRDLRAIAMTLSGHAYVDALLGDAASARAQSREAVSTMQRTGDLPGVAISINNAGLIELELGSVADALPLIGQSVEMADLVTPLHAIGWQQLLLAHLNQAVGDSDGSAGAVTQASAVFDSLDDERGRRAVQRARKAGGVTMPS